MRQTQIAANPFMMMMSPEVVLSAMERSTRLNSLERRVCRPLDRPLIPQVLEGELVNDDAAIDADMSGDTEGDLDA
jgi:hypothetical protein